MMHRHRDGSRVVCYYCKQDMHGFCVNGLDPDDVLAGAIYCHCTQCEPDGCGQESCYKPRRLTRRANVNRWKWDDPRWG